LMVNRVELIGSYIPEPDRAEAYGDADPDERISVCIYLKSDSTDFPPNDAPSEIVVPTTRCKLIAERKAKLATAGDTVRKYAERQRLAAQEDLAHGCIHLNGSLVQLSKCFGTSLRMYCSANHRFRARSGTLLIPEEIAHWTHAVLGLDCRPTVTHRMTSLASASGSSGMWPTEVAGLYGLPPELDAAGQCVGVIALGGGYLPSDLALAASSMRRSPPFVIDYFVAGVTNAFSGGDLADQEIALDLQVLAALIPSARIVVYFAANNTQSLANAIQHAISDDVNRPHVLSISWGSAEKFWGDSGRNAVQSALMDAIRLKVSVVVAAGDFLATGGIADGSANVLFPASSPYALSCGGTKIILAPDGLTLGGEVVWNDGFTGTGGGISDFFEIPDYQANIDLPRSVNNSRCGRGLPDVAAMAAQNPGYRIVVDGQTVVKEGTSAAAPLWAAIIAMANQQRGEPVGFINRFLYDTSSICRGITLGNNRNNGVGYDAGPDWNACAGLGVPVGVHTVNALAAMP
jgi:kumamolisin